MTTTNKIKGLIVPFLIGGTIVSTIKFVSENINNPGLAAMVGGIPTGLLGMYFLNQTQASQYSYHYFFNALILSFSILFFYIMINNVKLLNKNLLLLITLLIWGSIVFVVTKLTS